MALVLRVYDGDLRIVGAVVVNGYLADLLAFVDRKRAEVGNVRGYVVLYFLVLHDYQIVEVDVAAGFAQSQLVQLKVGI